MEDEEKENNIESSNKIFLFNETKKPEDDEPNKDTKKDNSDRKDNNINLKKTFTLGFNFLKRKEINNIEKGKKMKIKLKKQKPIHKMMKVKNFFKYILIIFLFNFLFNVIKVNA